MVLDAENAIVFSFHRDMSRFLYNIFHIFDPDLCIAIRDLMKGKLVLDDVALAHMWLPALQAISGFSQECFKVFKLPQDISRAYSFCWSAAEASTSPNAFLYPPGVEPYVSIYRQRTIDASSVNKCRTASIWIKATFDGIRVADWKEFARRRLEREKQVLSGVSDYLSDYIPRLSKSVVPSAVPHNPAGAVGTATNAPVFPQMTMLPPFPAAAHNPLYPQDHTFTAQFPSAYQSGFPFTQNINGSYRRVMHPNISQQPFIFPRTPSATSTDSQLVGQTSMVSQATMTGQATLAGQATMPGTTSVAHDSQESALSIPGGPAAKANFFPAASPWLHSDSFQGNYPMHQVSAYHIPQASTYQGSTSFIASVHGAQEDWLDQPVGSKRKAKDNDQLDRRTMFRHDY
ncbi:hypothetical protein DFH11DRAFT_1314816 [Phellopilus nigrolimitatus]|nr:hypothetical protein DFH11DRAFT_1314816 [Phellopilus nigrolimitatus]